MINELGRRSCLAWALLGGLSALIPCHGHAAEVIVQAKSFIRTVDLTDKNQFDPGAKSCQAAMAAVVACGTLGGEEPPSGANDSKQFRLWTQLKANVECSGDKVSKWDIRPVVIDTGNEFVMVTTSGDLSPGLAASPSASGTSAVSKVDFSYRMRGQPNAAGILLMKGVKPRTCTYINHSISGSLSCKQGAPVVTASLKGSGFPSHRLWVNGALVKDLPQGPFDNLWKCDPAEPTFVK